MPKYSIYIIRNLTNGKVYIGKSTNPQVRKLNHFYKLRKGIHGNPHLQSSYDKYGRDAFAFAILKYCNSEKEMNQSEIEEIAKARESDNCYNLLSGGDGGSHSEETKEKLRQAHLGQKRKPFSEEHKEKIGQAHLGNKNFLGHSHSEESKEKLRQAQLGNKNFLGHSHSEETKEKMRQAQLGKILSEETKEKMRQAHLGKKYL